MARDRGWANGYRAFRTFVIATLVASPFVGLGGVRFVSCAFDDGPVKPRVVEVVDAQSPRNAKSGTSYTLVVRSWRPGGDTEEITTTAGLFEAAKNATRVRVGTRPGVLGGEWLVRCDSVP